MDLSWFVRRERSAQVVGLALRVLLLGLAVPAIYAAWFLPFLSHVLEAGSLDPWSSFIRRGGSDVAFPYGPLYVLVFGPLSWAFGTISPRLAALGLGFTVLILDILLFLILRRLAPRSQGAIVTYGYWLSPIVLYVLYWHGQLDVFPVLLLAASLLLLRELRISQAGVMLGLATAAKLSMGLAIPFIWIYAITTRRLRDVAPRLVLGTLAGLATLIPFLLSPGFREMVLDTPEKDKVFALAIPYGAGLQFYVMPLAFAALIALAWRIRRFNFDVLFNLVGVGFFILFLLTPASPGWAMWLMPFLVAHMARAGRTSWALAILFSGLFTLFHLAASSGAAPLPFGGLFDVPHLRNLLLSAYLAVGGAIAFQMFHWGVVRDPFYRATRAPLVLGIAGDSGAGKDTLAEALGGLFGAPSTALVSGDDYHLWDRHKPMWRALTHLNPRANNLHGFTEDTLALANGWRVQAPHYDHHVGRMTKPLVTQPTDVIIAAGLHALYPAELLAIYDLKIFLAMDEDLRRFFKLRRDVIVRGHSAESVLASLGKREADSNRYIRPQANAADLIISLVPIDPRDVAEPLTSLGKVRMGLAVEARSTSDLTPMVRALVGVAGLSLVQEAGASGHGRVIIEGDPSPQDIAAAVRALTPDMLEYLALAPGWSGGLTGIMQLVVLDQIAQRIHRTRKVR